MAEPQHHAPPPARHATSGSGRSHGLTNPLGVVYIREPRPTNRYGLTQLVSWPETHDMSSGALQETSLKNPAILSLIGNTPLVECTRVETGPCRLFIKLENQNPTGSIKDRMALAMV